MTCSSSTTFRPRPVPLALGLLAGLALAGLALAGPARADGAPDATAAIARARAAIAAGDGVTAEVTLREAESRGVPADATRAYLGKALLLEGNLDAAQDVLANGHFAPGTEGSGWRARGELAIAQGDLPAAGKAFDQALRIDARDPRLWVDIARLRFLGGEQAQAFDAARRAAQLGPQDPRALEMLGLMVRERHGLVPALAVFERGLALAPADKGLLAEYAATLGDAGRYREMLAATRALMKADPGNPRGYYLQAVLAARAGETDLARRLMLKTGTALRDSAGAILLNGVLEFRAGNINLAIEYLDRLVRMQPDNLRARDLLARALARDGDWEDLLRRFGGQAMKDGASPYLVALAARALEERGERARAAPLLERVVGAVQTPFSPMEARQPLGVLAISYADAPYAAGNAVPFIRSLLAAGDSDRALQAAIVLRNANPGSSDAQALVGDVRVASGDPAGAVADYRKAMAIRHSADLLARLVGALRASGQDAQADAAAAGYLAHEPRDIEAMRLLAAGDARAGRWNDASRLLAALAARSQGGPLSLAQRSAMALEEGDIPRATDLASLAYRAQPGSPFAARAYGQALKSGGDGGALPRDLLRQADAAGPLNRQTGK
ncbi:tetratricopeptide repeat protein [Novosphingobium sp. ZN18A2]|uniref:tetratricopeptide repeat protein n=1 Tax=Novosphingobium sp. ZN18A2 TaxID=3079861 RepID=UPI0030CB169E